MNDVMTCVECEAQATEKHHVIPRSRGGTFTVDLCGACHGLVHNVRRSDDHGALIREGHARARARGVVWGGNSGRPRAAPPHIRARIVQERVDGATFNQIANRLNDDGVPTANVTSRWCGSTIRKILMQEGVHKPRPHGQRRVSA